MPNIPHDTSKGVHSVPFDRVIYIDQSDFREVGGGNNFYPDYMPVSSRSCRPPFSPLFCHSSADAHSPYTPCAPHFTASFLTHLILYTPHTVQTPPCTLPTLYTNHGTICVLIRSSCLSLLNTIGCLSPLCLCDCLLCLQDVPPGYRRLAPQQPVGLRHAGFTISVEKVTKVRQKCVGVNV